MQPENMYDVLVIGAGPSGIAAARQLHKYGINYLILEGRQRIGGRTHTQTIDGVLVDIGACWMHDFHGNSQNPLHTVVQELQIAELNLKREHQQNFYDVPLQRKLVKEEVEQAYSFFKEFQDHVATVCQKNGQDISVFEAGSDMLKKAEDLPPAVKRCFGALLNGAENYDAATIKQLSASQWCLNYDLGVENSNFLPVGGYSNFLSKASAHLKVELDKKIISIDKDVNQILIKCRDGSIYSCKKCIASLPLGVLKGNQVKFNPPLPPTYQAAINRLGFGRMEKVIASFQQNFWGQTEWISIGFELDKRSNFTHSFNFSQGNKNILCAFLTEQFAKSMDHKSDQQTISELVSLYSHLFGKEKVKLIEASVTRWGDDEFCMGSYSFFKVGSSGKDSNLLSKPIDDMIWLVGEHCNQKSLGSVNGAWQSGLDASVEILKYLGKQ